MKGKRRSLRAAFSTARLLLAALGVLGAGLIVFVVISKPPNPVSEITVIDGAGNPISGAVITPYALRPKAVGGHSGHYSWTTNQPAAKPDPVVTDKSGLAVLSNVPIRTTQFAVGHSNYVLPKVKTGFLSGERRAATVSLSPAATTKISVTLEPKERDPMRHY